MDNTFIEDEVPTQESDFWIHLPDDELGDAVVELARKFDDETDQNGMRRLWLKKWRFYYGRFHDGLHGDTTGLQTVGDNDEYVFLASNQFRSLAKQIYNHVIQNPPSFDVSAANTDTSSIQLASLGGNILDYYLRHRNVKEKLERAVEHALIFDAGYLLVEWDELEGKEFGQYVDPETGRLVYEGDLRITNPTAFDVIFDPLKETWEQQEWVIVREWVPRSEMFQRYWNKPELSKAILQAKSKQDEVADYARSHVTVSRSARDLNDDVLVYKLFHKKTEAVPDGKALVTLADGTVLFSSFLPYQRLPLLRMVPNELIGGPWGYSPLNDILSQQEALNVMNSTIMTSTYTHGLQVIVAPKGTDVNPQYLGRGLTMIEYNGERPPEPMNYCKVPPEVFQFRSMLLDEMELIVGVSEQSRGVSKSGSSGANNALMISQTAQNNGQIQNNYAEFCGYVGTHMLEIIKNFANNPRTIAIIGNSNPSKTVFTGNDLEGIDRVTVDLGNPLTRTYAGKLQTAQELLRSGAINPQDFFEVLTTGNLETAYEGVRGELNWVHQENDYLLQGQAINVHPLDNHDLHIAYHRRLLQRKETRIPSSEQDLQLLQAIQEHISQHEQATARSQMMNMPAPPQEPGAPVASAQQQSPDGPPQAPGRPPNAVEAGVVSENAANGRPMPNMPEPAQPPQ